MINGKWCCRFHPARICLQDIQHPVITISPHCIQLSERARNYELKMGHFNMLPSFHGLANEDQLSFIREFYVVVRTFSLNGVTKDDLWMRCFPYYLKDRTKS